MVSDDQPEQMHWLYGLLRYVQAWCVCNKNDKPKVIYREGCVEGCHGCGNQCPQGAIVYSGDFKSAIKCACNCDGKED